MAEWTSCDRVIVGVDIGQLSDYTAIAVLNQMQWRNNNYVIGEPIKRGGKKIGKPFYDISLLERPALGTPYPVIIERIKEVVTGLKEKNGPKPELVIDSTGVGKPVFDMFLQAGFKPIGISIHGGQNVSENKNIWNVPKRDLAGVMQVVYQNKRIRVSRKLPLAETLNNELLNFKVKINIATGHDSYEAWREGIHDDLVLAVACGCWWAEKPIRLIKAGERIPGL